MWSKHVIDVYGVQWLGEQILEPGDQKFEFQFNHLVSESS